MSESPAETLRRAAKLMRKEGGWIWTVADWLYDEAGRYDSLADTPYGIAGAAFVAGDFGGYVDPALKVACAYLGET